MKKFYRRLIPICIWLWGYVSAELGPENCTETVAINQTESSTPGTVYVSSVTVCFECIIGGSLATDATFTIINSFVDPSEGRVVNGTLMVFDSESSFSSATSVRCSRSNSARYAVQVLHRILRAPMIRGKTTVNEGDILELVCNASNSRPLPFVYWVSPSRDTIAIGQDLRIEDIAPNLAGSYSCIASQSSFNATITSSVDVIVNLKCQEVISTDQISLYISSTIVGSNATYQCIEGPTDVHTTQCTSNGSWIPDPYSLDCPDESSTELTKPTKLVTCGKLRSTDQILVEVTSNTTATYQCSDSTTDVYTTHCTSDGVWDPDPFSSLDCDTTTKPDSSSERKESNNGEIAIVLGVLLPLLLILCITTVVIVLFALKRQTCFKQRKDIYKKSREEGTATTADGEQTIMMGNTLYSEILPQSNKTTELNGQCESALTNPPTPLDTEPNGVISQNQTEQSNTQPVPLYSVVQKKSKAKGASQVTNALYSVVQKKPKAKGSPQVTNALYSVVQKKPKQTKDVQTNHLQPQNATSDLFSTSNNPEPHSDPDKENERQLATRKSHTPSPPPPPIPKYAPASTKTIIYAEVGPQISPTPLTINKEKDRVEYATLDHMATLKAAPSPQTTQQPHADADATVCLDQILIQLKEVAPQWRKLGETVGVERLDEISQCVSSDAEAMVEVVDGWLAKLHPKKPTWKDIADIAGSIGHPQLANSLREVYISGVLPVEVSNALPISLTVKEPPPPLPPRETD